MNTMVKQAIEHWQYVAPVLTAPCSDVEYKALAATLDELLDIAGDDESHPLSGLIEQVGNVIAAYDAAHYPIPKAAPRHVLAFLMEQHGLTQSDLADVAPQSIISDLLNDKRQFNTHHIRALCQRFGVSADTFL